MALNETQKAMIQLAIDYEALKFGTFTLKSGRESPYFFNAGVFNDGAALAKLGEIYANTVQESGVEYDVIFGPAYKGIPLGTTMAVALQTHHGRNALVSYNRKEAKDHGEGGVLVGASMADRKVLVIDDVITAGTAIRESRQIIETAGGKIAGVVVALDREEKGKDTDLSAIQAVEKEFGVPVYSVIKFSSIVRYLEEQNVDGKNDATIKAMREYRDKYGA